MCDALLELQSKFKDDCLKHGAQTNVTVRQRRCRFCILSKQTLVRINVLSQLRMKIRIHVHFKHNIGNETRVYQR